MFPKNSGIIRTGRQALKELLIPSKSLFSSEQAASTNMMGGAAHHGVSGGDTKTYWEVEDKTSISFSMADAPGSLQRALNVFTARGINLTRIQSRPPKMID